MGRVINLKRQIKRAVSGDVRVGCWDQHKLLYVRIPKSGNSSILAAVDGVERRRMTAGSIAGIDGSWTTFSFVRNPWARLLSTYLQKVGGRGGASKKNFDGVYHGFASAGIPIHKDMSFESFCEAICEISDRDTDKHLQSQAYILIRAGKPIVSMIGRMENMASDWKLIMDSARLDFQLPHRNRTSKQGEHYSSFYNDRLVQRVADRYEDDIKHFSYEFEVESTARNKAN